MKNLQIPEGGTRDIVSEKNLSKIQQSRSTIMTLPEMEAHIERWGFSFIRAKVLVFNPDSKKILMVEEKRARVNGKWEDVHDVWNFPGGSLQAPTEDLFSAACREVREETKCDIELTGFIGVEQRMLEDDPCVTFLFVGEYRGEIPGELDSKEIWRVAWLSKVEIEQLYLNNKMRSGELNDRMLRQYESALDLSMVTFR